MAIGWPLPGSQIDVSIIKQAKRITINSSRTALLSLNLENASGRGEAEREGGNIILICSCISTAVACLSKNSLSVALRMFRLYASVE